MRLALSLASVLVLGSAAFAEDAAAPTPAPAPTAPAPAARKLPLRVVRVLDDTQQALLFDKAKSTHVLVEVGKQIDGFTVTDIDEDTVTLTAEGGQQIVLAGPDPSWREHGRRTPKAAAKQAVEPAPQDPYAGAAPMDPYAEDEVRTASAAAPSATAAPITAGEGGVRTAEAPAVAPPAESIRSAEAPGTPAKVIVTAAIPASTIPTVVPASTTPTAAPIVAAPVVQPVAASSAEPAAPVVAAAPVVQPVAAPSAAPAAPQDTSSSAAWSTTPTPAPAVDPEAAAIADLFSDAKPEAKPGSKTKPTKAADKKIASVPAAGTPAAATPPVDGATVIAKADVTAALGNFGALAGAVRGSFGADGAHLDAVAPDSLFAKAGLQAGDTVTAVNNQPLRSLDDAATLYARAGALKSATIQVTRAGKPLSLRLAIQ